MSVVVNGNSFKGSLKKMTSGFQLDVQCPYIRYKKPVELLLC
jgi:hypothetical protein